MSPPAGKKFEELVALMAHLRAPDGCPWDREQTFDTIMPHTLEEVHEVLDAIERKDFDDLREELGDLLLQIVFYAQMAAEERRFTIDDVCDAIIKKLIHRHPHVFGEAKVSGSGEVLKNWEGLKQREKPAGRSILAGVPKALPALLRAFRLSEKAARSGFDWPDAEGVLDKVEEEVRELHAASRAGDAAAIDHEFGDLLFALANAARFLTLDPEGSLRRATERFQRRFEHMERSAAAQGRDLATLSASEWEALWSAAKRETA